MGLREKADAKNCGMDPTKKASGQGGPGIGSVPGEGHGASGYFRVRAVATHPFPKKWEVRMS